MLFSQMLLLIITSILSHIVNQVFMNHLGNPLCKAWMHIQTLNGLSVNCSGCSSCDEYAYKPYMEHQKITEYTHVMWWLHLYGIICEFSFLNVYFVNEQTHIPLICFHTNFYECDTCTTNPLVGGYTHTLTHTHARTHAHTPPV